MNASCRLLLIAVLALQCLRCGPQQAAEQPPQKSAADGIVCRVDARRELGQVPRRLFGTNVEWFNSAGGLWKEPSINAELERLARGQGISVVRFPGGTLSDFYNWRDGIGPRQRRPVRQHPTDSGRSANSFGTAELARFCRSISAEPMITVNAGAGTAADAAAWVAYCNEKNNRERLADGMTEPLNIRLWEVGNELYLAGNPVEKSISIPPDAYAERFLSYARAMRSVDPTISLIALGVAQSTRIPIVPYADWTKTVLARCAADIDFIAVHNAYFPVLIAVRAPAVKDVYQALWASPEAVGRSLTELERLIAQHKKERDIGIAVTEWGAIFSILDPLWADHVKTMGTAVYCARIMQVFLEHPAVRIANYFKFTDTTPMGWVAFNGIPKVAYYSLALFTQHFGSLLVASSITGSPAYASPQMGLTAAEKSVAEVTAVASLSSSRDRLFVNIVNRSWDASRSIRLDLAGFAAAGDSAVIWSLAGAGPCAHNGPDVPSWWPVKVVEPDGQALPKKHIAIQSGQISLRQPIEIPPHAVITVEIPGKPL
jgi:alpha-N-arabinofuranosidase